METKVGRASDPTKAAGRNELTQEQFVSECCAPMLKGQSWETAVVQKYNKQKDSLPGYACCTAMLQSERGRSRIMSLGFNLSWA